MSDAPSFSSMLRKLTPHRWSELAKELNKWHYLTQDAVWLRENEVTAIAHTHPEKYVAALIHSLKEHGYSGGKLEFAVINQGENETPVYLIYDSDRLKTADAVERAYIESEPKRWHILIAGRVQNWLKRLRNLQSIVTRWVRESGMEELTIENAEPCLMREEFMVRYKVPDTKMPSFKVLRNRTQVALFRPKALWVVGANGRVDIVTKSGAPMLVDVSEPMSAESHWKLYPTGKTNAVEFTEEQFFKLISK